MADGLGDVSKDGPRRRPLEKSRRVLARPLIRRQNVLDLHANSPGARIGRDMLWRGLSRGRNRLSHHVVPRWKGHSSSPSPHDFATETVACLRKLLEL